MTADRARRLSGQLRRCFWLGGHRPPRQGGRLCGFSTPAWGRLLTAREERGRVGQRQGGAISWVKNNATKRGAAEVSGTPCGVLQSSSLLRVMFAIFRKRRKPRGENVKCLLLLLLLLTIDSKTERSFTSRGQKPGFRQSVGNDRLQNWPPGHRRPWSLKDGASPTTARHPAPRGSRVSTGRQAHTAPRRVRERKKRN